MFEFLDKAGLTALVGKIKSELAKKAEAVHDHNTQYYQKMETYNQTEVNTKIAEAVAGGTVDMSWSSITDKPTAFPPIEHEHSLYDIPDVAVIPTDFVTGTIWD